MADCAPPLVPMLLPVMLRLCITRTLLAASLAWGGSAIAQTQVDVAGVKYPAAASVGGSSLLLNGAGIRYRTVFKVYTAGLYLSRKASTPEEVLAAPGPKRMSVTMLREIDSAELGRLFARGVEDNLDKGSFARIVPGILRMGQIFAEHRKLAPGDNFLIDWIPGVGTVITVKGVPQGEAFKEPEFFNALMMIWLGRAPADWRLKEQLLGKPV